MISLRQRLEKTSLLVSAVEVRFFFPDSVVSGNGASVLTPIAELWCEVSL